MTGKIEDPFDGARDIERGRLAAVDPKTFSEDPLRALRVVQFAARFGFSVHPDLSVLCREARLLSLPPERVWGELEKLLLRAPAPSMGWMLLHDLRIASKVLPDVADIPPEQVAAAPPQYRTPIAWARCAVLDIRFIHLRDHSWH